MNGAAEAGSDRTVVAEWPEVDSVRAGVLELLPHHVWRVAVDDLFNLSVNG